VLVQWLKFKQGTYSTGFKSQGTACITICKFSYFSKKRNILRAFVENIQFLVRVFLRAFA